MPHEPRFAPLADGGVDAAHARAVLAQDGVEHERALARAGLARHQQRLAAAQRGERVQRLNRQRAGVLGVVACSMQQGMRPQGPLQATSCGGCAMLCTESAIAQWLQVVPAESASGLQPNLSANLHIRHPSCPVKKTASQIRAALQGAPLRQSQSAEACALSQGRKPEPVIVAP